MIAESKVIPLQNIGLGDLNLNYILLSSDPISEVDCVLPTLEKFKEKTLLIETLEKEILIDKFKAEILGRKNFENQILLLLKRSIKIKRVSAPLKREIQIFYGRIQIQIKIVERYREAREFYSELGNLCREKNLKEILIKFQNLSKNNKQFIFQMCKHSALITILRTGKNNSSYSSNEICNALRPVYSSLDYKNSIFLSEDKLIRYALTEIINNFLIKISIPYNVNLSLTEKSAVRDQGGQDERNANAKKRYKGPGVDLIKFIDKFFFLNELLDRPVTYKKIIYKKSLNSKKVAILPSALIKTNNIAE